MQGRQWARGGKLPGRRLTSYFQQSKAGRQAGGLKGRQAGRPASQNATAQAPQRARTRLHSVPSAFQLVTAAVVLRNMRKPTFAILSAVSRKSLHRWVLLLARYSSIRRCPMLNPLQVAGTVTLRGQVREVGSGGQPAVQRDAGREEGLAGTGSGSGGAAARRRPSHLV